MDEVAKSPPDGYTLLLAHSGLTYMPGLYRKLPFDPVKDFDGIVIAVSGIYVLAVNLDLPVKSVAELIAYAKANPGKLSLRVGRNRIVAPSGRRVFQARGRRRHRARALQGRRGGGDRSGRRPDPDDVRSRRSTILPLAQAGKIRALAVTSAKRSALAPDLPTMAETRAGLRRRRLVRARRACRHAEGRDRTGSMPSTNRALQSPDLIAQLRDAGLRADRRHAGRGRCARIKSDVARWTKIIQRRRHPGAIDDPWIRTSRPMRKR